MVETWKAVHPKEDSHKLKAFPLRWLSWPEAIGFIDGQRSNSGRSSDDESQTGKAMTSHRRNKSLTTGLRIVCECRYCNSQTIRRVGWFGRVTCSSNVLRRPHSFRPNKGGRQLAAREELLSLKSSNQTAWLIKRLVCQKFSWTAWIYRTSP